MARNFVLANPDHLFVASTPITAVPFWIHCLARIGSLSTTQLLVRISDGTATFALPRP